MNRSQFFASALCALSLAPLGIACATDAPATTDAPAKAQTPATRPTMNIVRDADAWRAISIATDRDETVEQFFARQHLIIIDNANADGKPLSVSQLVKETPGEVFVNYPLANHQGFRPYMYGGFFEMDREPLANAPIAGDPNATWKNTLLILAPEQPDETKSKARLVGFITLKDGSNWRPEEEAEKLKYQQPKADAEN